MRTKEVFKSGELAHIWAHGRAERGRCASAMRFEGDTFFSYNTAIARRLVGKGGRVCFVLNVTSYSGTTSGHQSHVRRAIPEGAAIFRVGDMPRGVTLWGDWRQVGAWLFEYRKRRVLEFEKRGDAARIKASKGEAYAVAESEAAEAARVFEFFGIRARIPAAALRRIEAKRAEFAADVEAKEAKLQARRDAANAARGARWAAAEAARIAEDEERLTAWLAGERVQAPCALPAAVMRIAPDDGAIVETSKGARVPLDRVRLGLRFVMSKRATGWRRNGETFALGEYQLDSVSAAGVVAGCHRFDWAEVERFAAVLGVGLVGGEVEKLNVEG